MVKFQSLLHKGRTVNLTAADFSNWSVLQPFNNCTEVSRNDDIVLKMSTTNFPDVRYAIGLTECSMLKYIEANAFMNTRFPRCIATSQVWFEGNTFYATGITYVKGEPFDEAIEKATSMQLYEIVKDLLSALETMDDLGITHRDIDSKNVLVENLSTVKIIDFALATSAAIPAEG